MPPQVHTITLRELMSLAQEERRSNLHTLFLHWTAGRYSQVFDDYHINIGKEGELYLTCRSLSERKCHTWKRNTGAIGIALDCAFGATCSIRNIDGGKPHISWGDYPPTQAQIERLAQVVAVITDGLGLAINEYTVMTHQEIASLDGYGPGSGDAETRWDLWYLPDLPLSDKLTQGGHVLRGKAIWYRAQMQS